MAIDPYSFAAALAAWMAAQAGVEHTGTPRALWHGQAVEGASCADTYTVLTAYAAALQPIGLPSVSIQLMTRGVDAEAAAQASLLFNVLLADGLPRQQLAIDGHKVIAFVALRPPVPISRDTTTRRVEIVANFDAKFAPT